MATTIRKALISSFSTHDDVTTISVVSAPLPAPGKKHVQVRVSYAGFSGADINMRMGIYPMQRKAPLTPGYCMVGRVAAIGPSCTPQYRVGDMVAAVTTYDAQAELINVDESLLIPVPQELAVRDDLVQQTAALVLDWNTAYGMVSHATDVQSGQSVFVHGLSGAVGQGLMTLCLLRGARVYGTASKRNHQTLLDAGCAGVFEYRNKGWVQAMKELGGADAVFDPLGFESWDESFSILSGKGILVGYGGNQAVLSGGEEKPRSPLPHIAKLLAKGASPFCGKRTSFYYIKPGTSTCAADLQACMGLLKKGKIQVPIKAVWELNTEGIRDAHRSWGKIEGMGSLLIRVGADGV
ncbi:zinc-binding dehydrogenase [Diplogelasinospora grovesii]|uniref:Zinc-binding dehydrogenase n=1 Tax=Diplogelasinospora grovesii TaxID=303347 RepID=A0AAN6N0Z7_9PEZI|nr:zinc-binding dehydrogenase [Diplogelasinospora grovesii]